MKELIEELRSEREEILKRRPELSLFADWTYDCFILDYNEKIINKLRKILKNESRHI